MTTPNNPSKGPNQGSEGDPNRPLPDPRRPPEKNGGPHYTPWLVVRYQAGDAGDRPLAPGTVFWESPDVWSQGSQGINQPVVNEPTQVFARVTNQGMQDSVNATIQYWWANPSIAITEATATPIGTLTGVTIPAQNSLVFQSPTDWVPIKVNNGHECLIVQAFDDLFDPLTHPMQPAVDRHVGQKNEHLVTLQPGMKFEFLLEARNFTDQDREIVVEVRPGLIPRNFAKLFGRPGQFPPELLDPPTALPVQVDIGAHPIGTTPPPLTGVTARLQTPTGGVAAGVECLGPAQASGTQLFKAREVRRVTIVGTLPPSASPGEVYVVRITQSIGPAVLGGYTLYVTFDPGRPR